MKIFLTTLFAVFLTTEIRADLSNQPNKIQSLVKKLFNLKPDQATAHGLGKPLKLPPGEEKVEIEPILADDNGIQFYSNFKNATITKLNTNSKFGNQKNHYTSLICDFHEQLKISQSIEPSDVEIKGIYESNQTLLESKKPEMSFFIRQYDGKISYQIVSNGTNHTEVVYKNPEMKFGESTKHQAMMIKSMGILIDQVNDNTANQANQNTNLPRKIEDFKHIFPFLSDGLSPINKTALKSQDENTYCINNTKSEQWANMHWIMPYVVIRGLNNFKRVKIIASSSDDQPEVHFNMTLSTNKLGGYFEWQYGKDGITTMANLRQNFTIDNLTMVVNTIFKTDWIVDKIEVNLGSINILKSDGNNPYPDVNDFAYDIFHENLETLIKSHLKQLIHDEYSQPIIAETKPLKDGLNTTSTYNCFNNTNQTTIDIWNLRNSPNKQLLSNILNRTKNKQNTMASTLLPTNTTPCIDDRKWWQKIYRRNKCKDVKIQQTNVPTQKTREAQNDCIDSRWWFQKPFSKNKCAINFTMDKIPKDFYLQNRDAEECIDTRWWFQKPFIRNKCKPTEPEMINLSE